MTVWGFYFGWYQGAVYSNLLASAICTGLVYWRAKIHLRRQAEQHARTHALLLRIHEHLGVDIPEEGDP